MHRITAAVFIFAMTFLVGDAFVKSQHLVPLGRWLLMIAVLVSGFLWLATTAALRPLFPTLAIERGGGPGVGLRLLPPAGRQRSRLKKETLALVRDIHEHLKTAPRSWSSLGRVPDPTASEEEQRHQWEEQTQQLLQGSENEWRTNLRLFGGQVHHVLDGFERLGMLSEGGRDFRSFLEWAMGSNHWLSEAAARLEALPLKL
jgi:hypothetical protein